MLKNSYRLKFEKIGMMKFIGHLDLLKVVQRSINRSKLPISYSKGFNPHQIISFALPLSLGFSTTGDYFEIDLDEDIETEEIKQLLNTTLPKDLKVIACFKRNENDGKCAALLCASQYQIKGFEFENISNKFSDFLEQKEIFILKKTKKNEKEVDIKKDILNWHFDEHLYITTSTGSNNNLKIDLVLEAFYNFLNLSFEIHKLNICRTEMFYLCDDELTPLGVGAK